MERRDFVAGLVGTMAASSIPASSQGATLLEADATRISSSIVRLKWNDKATAATVRISEKSDSPLFLMREIQTGIRGGKVDLVAPKSPRPYFAITNSRGQQLRVAERLLPLEGGRNFRDLGGYRARDGRSVRWGQIFRSGVMATLTSADLTYLSSLGVSVICDLRSAEERKSEPSKLQASDAVRTISREYEMSSSMASLARATTRLEAIDAFASAYVDFTAMLAPQYTEMFASLLEDRSPIAVNCTAGKDRTGVASALILAILGVDRKTVIADYALSETYVPASYYLAQGQRSKDTPSSGSSSQMAALSRLPPAVSKVILGTDPEVMRLALARIDTKFGGPIALAKSKFGLTDASIRRLRDLHLA